MDVGEIEVKLVIRLKLLRDLASGRLADAAELLAKSAPEEDLEALSKELKKLADTVPRMVRDALDFVERSGSAVGKGVAEEAQKLSDKLFEMVRLLKEDPVKEKEKELEGDLAKLEKYVPGILEKAANILQDKGHDKSEREKVSYRVMKLSNTAEALENNALAFVKWSGSPVGKEVVQEAGRMAYDLFEMADRLDGRCVPCVDDIET